MDGGGGIWGRALHALLLLWGSRPAITSANATHALRSRTRYGGLLLLDDGWGWRLLELHRHLPDLIPVLVGLISKRWVIHGGLNVQFQGSTKSRG